MLDSLCFALSCFKLLLASALDIGAVPTTMFCHGCSFFKTLVIIPYKSEQLAYSPVIFHGCLTVCYDNVMNFYVFLGVLLITAAPLLAVRLPSFMTRLGMSRADKIAFVVIAFSMLGLGLLVVVIFHTIL